MQQLLLALLIFAEAAGKTRQLAAIKLDDARANAVQKGTVVGNEKQRHIGFDQQVLQPFNRRDIEVVGDRLYHIFRFFFYELKTDLYIFYRFCREVQQHQGVESSLDPVGGASAKDSLGPFSFLVSNFPLL